MHAASDRDSSRRSTAADAVLFSACAIGVVLVAIFIWGLRDANRDRRVQLIADTRPPQVLPVTAGRLSHTSAEEFAAFYPARLKAHAGDTVRFTNPTIEDPHSVTFGLQPSRANQPSFGNGVALPHIYGPCVSDTPLAVSSTQCTGLAATTTSLPAYSGQPYYNSGIIAPGGGTFDLRLSPSLASGTYDFFCVIHPGQTGAIEVVETTELTQRPETLVANANAQFDHDVKELRRFLRDADRGLLDPAGTTIRAGAAATRVSLNRFLPSEVTINAGDGVTWTNTGSVPHVMVFGGVLAPPVAVETPPTRPSGSFITDGLFTTGPIGSWPYPRTEFTARFEKRGRYEYACWLHPGMTGSIIVR